MAYRYVEPINLSNRDIPLQRKIESHTKFFKAEQKLELKSAKLLENVLNSVSIHQRFGGVQHPNDIGIVIDFR